MTAWTYNNEGAPKPYLHPVTTPAGRTLTRVSPPDHVWHRGLWFAIKYVDGDNFWEEDPPFGTARHTGPSSLEWVRPNGTVALTEERTMVHVPLDDDDGYAIDCSFALTAPAEVVLDRTPYTTWGGYGGLTLRGRGDWTDTRLLLAGAEPQPRPKVVGEPAAWCDLTGTVDGAVAGLALLDHPANDRSPVPWYGSVRSPVYGTDGWSNFLNAAFLFHDPMTLAAGETLALRYRVLVHDGWWDPARLDRAHADWIAAPSS